MTRPQLVSVVVPVYRVEPYLRRCVESLLAQTYPELQIILVDDGSPDACPAICDEFAARDPRVEVVHQSNAGLAAARNTGVARARGEWLAFVDSDDWAAPVLVETLARAALQTGADMAAVPGGTSYTGAAEPSLAAQVPDELACTELSPHDYLRLVLYQAAETNMQSRLCRRSLFEGIAFPEGRLFEDLAVTYRLVHAASSIAYVDTARLYAYRVRADGIIGSDYAPLKRASMVEATRSLYRDVCAWYPELAAAAASRCFSGLRSVYAQVPRALDADRAVLWEELAAYRRVVVADPGARRRERFAAALAIAGHAPFDLFCQACRRAGLMR